MQTIEIRNVGPIRHAEMELKQFNFFIGEQGSGKSTIAKVVSYCSWLEKEVLTHPDLQDNGAFIQLMEADFGDGLSDFHAMEGYLRKDSYIHYRSECIDIKYDGWGHIEVLQGLYKRKKILYIPAERNYALRRYDSTSEDNIKSFVRDFASARDFYQKKERLPLPGIGAEYYSETEPEGGRVDKITSGGVYDIKLKNASSGMQSMTPIAVTVDFYSSRFYNPGVEGKTISVDSGRDRTEVRNYVYDLCQDEEVRQDMVNRLLFTHSTTFVIEEPELSLYPSTQRDLLNYIVGRCSGERQHQLIVTTHSPYLVNQLNLLLKAYDKDVKVGGASLDFDKVNVYAVQDGSLWGLKVKDDGVRLVDTVLLSDDINKIYDQFEQLKSL